MRDITISIVSHNQDYILSNLVKKLSKYSANISKVIITHNKFESNSLIDQDLPFEVLIIQNQQPKGFGANHNQAFENCNTPFFCVMNPDIDINIDPFNILKSNFTDSLTGIVAPSVYNLQGEVEDTARYFPTPFSILRKILFNYNGAFKSDSMEICYPDWVGGMFLLFRSSIFKDLAGFDEKYFLYYEDVDICLRLWKYGFKIIQSKEIFVIHDARRTSHTNVKYLKWHIESLLRFFITHFGRYPSRIY